MPRTTIKPRPVGHLLLEKDFQRTVIELARLHGWRAYSIPDSRRSTEKGYPDITLWHAKRKVFALAELKTVKGKLSAEQIAVHAELKACGMTVYVWRPDEWDEIEKVLGRWPN